MSYRKGLNTYYFLWLVCWLMLITACNHVEHILLFSILSCKYHMHSEFTKYHVHSEYTKYHMYIEYTKYHMYSEFTTVSTIFRVHCGPVPTVWYFSILFYSLAFVSYLCTCSSNSDTEEAEYVHTVTKYKRQTLSNCFKK